MPARLSTSHSMIGLLPTVSSGFALFSVSGYRRVAYPAARIRTFMRSKELAQSRKTLILSLVFSRHPQNRLFQILLNDPDPLRVGDLRMAGAIHHVQCVDRRASLGVNSRKSHQNIFALETAQHIIKQTDPVRGLNLNERVSRMRFVVDRDASRKVNSHRGTMARVLRFFDRWNEVEALVLECSAQRLFYKLEIARVGNGLRFCVTHAENAKHRVIAAGKNIGAQNVQRHDTS